MVHTRSMEAALSAAKHSPTKYLATTPTLDGMPPELLELVVRLLDLRDICSLRRTSTVVSGKASQGCFKMYFVTKTLRIHNNDELDNFASVTQAGRKGRHLERLTVVNSVPVTRDPLEDGEAMHALQAEALAKAFSTFKMNSIRGYLSSLTLKLEGLTPALKVIPVEKVANWGRVWSTAASTADLVTRAFKDSNLSVHELDMYGTGPRCALAIDRLGPIMDGMASSQIMSALVSLSLTLSNHHETDASDDSLEDADGCIDNVCRLLAIPRRLKTLKLRWYKMDNAYEARAKLENEYLFARIVHRAPLPDLQSCALRGIHANEADLLAFFRGFSPRKVTLEEIHLASSGTFRAIFDHLSSAPHLDYLRLEDLWESRLICFEIEGEPHFPSSEPSGPNDLTRVGAEARLPIPYRQSRGIALGSAACARWHKQKVLMYGPPSWHRTMFGKINT